MSSPPNRILISRTDAIGDVVLTLPVARALKHHFPAATIGFLAKPYTHPVLEACPDVDRILAPEEFMRGGSSSAWDAILHVLPSPEIARQAKRAEIRLRIGTTNRLYHWWTCNRLLRLSRKRSELHEAQLNLRLLEPLGIESKTSLQELPSMVRLEPVAPLPPIIKGMLSASGQKIILHPTSRGSARDWPLDRFLELGRLLAGRGAQVIVTGVEGDRSRLKPLIEAVKGEAIDMVGRLSLGELMRLMTYCNGLVAGSTGPLHLAAALGLATVGLYPPERPMHAGRWSPLGRFTECLVALPMPSSAVSNALEGISPEAVVTSLERLMDLRQAQESGY